MRTGLKIALVVVSLYLCLYALEKIYDFGLGQNRNSKLTAVRDLPAQAVILIHGPCEPLWMISPALLDRQTGLSSYNLALSHSDFADNYLHLYFYLRYNPPPRYLFLYVTPESFDKRFNTFNSYRFSPYLDDTLVRRVVKQNDPAYYACCFIPFMKYAYYSSKINFDVLQGYKHYFAGRRLAYYPDGFEPPAKRVWGNHAASFAELYEKNTVFSWDSLREDYLRRTIRLAKRYRIAVYLYESPVFEQALAYQPNRKEMIEKIGRLAKQEEVAFIRFDHLPMAKEKRLYISTLNFNMQGVKLFNDTLGKYIRTYLLKDPIQK